MYKELFLRFFYLSFRTVTISYFKFYRIISGICILSYGKAVIKTYKAFAFYLVKMSVIAGIVYFKRKYGVILIHNHLCSDIKGCKFSYILKIKTEVKYIRIDSSGCGLPLSKCECHILYYLITAVCSCRFLDVNIDILLYSSAACLTIS